MQEKATSQTGAVTTQKTQTNPKASADNASASGRWAAVHRARLPHKAGLPLSSGGCGDSGIR